MSVDGRMLRVVAVAAAAWVSAAVATRCPQVAAGLALSAWALAGTALVIACSRRVRTARLMAVSAIAVALAAAVCSHVALARQDRVAAADLAVDGGRAIVVEAVVVSKTRTTAGGTQMFDARARAITVGTRRVATDVPIAVRARGPAALGATVLVHGTATASRPGERAVFVLQARSMTGVGPPARVVAASAMLREGLAKATVGLPEPAAGLIPGLAVGDTAGVGEQLDGEMKASSLSHLTAVSGANCAIVVGLAFAAAAACGARRAVRVGVALVALAGFVLLVTPEPSVVRAAAMSAIAMLGVLLGRSGGGMALLCTAVAVVLVVDPWLAGSIGFALSAAATAALLVLAAPLAAGLARFLPRFVALALGVPLAAQLVCGPLLILIDPTVPLYGVLANILADPAAPVATVLGLAACLSAPFPALCSGLVALTWVPAAWIAATAHLAVVLPGSSVAWPAGWPGAVLLAAVGAAVVLVILPAGRRRLRRGVRTAAAMALTVLIGVGVGSAALRTVVAPLTIPDEWAIAACDIGQGDALLVRSAGAVAMIDTGPDPEPLRTCLRRLGIGRIDLLVLTHYDLDHVGGLDAVASMTTTALVGPVSEAGDTRTRRTLTTAGAKVVDARAGMHGRLGGAQWTVVWPPEGSAVFSGGNPASVTIEFRGGGVPTSVFLGDLDATAQRALAASGALHPPYAVVKVAHHGSADQDPELYRMLDPALAVISVGVDNDYGHPRPRTLAFLAADGATIARTDQDGLVLVSKDPDLSVWRERDPPADVAPSD